jgi:hypothetical protein
MRGGEGEAPKVADGIVFGGASNLPQRPPSVDRFAACGPGCSVGEKLPNACLIE